MFAAFRSESSGENEIWFRWILKIQFHPQTDWLNILVLVEYSKEFAVVLTVVYLAFTHLMVEDFTLGLHSNIEFLFESVSLVYQLNKLVDSVIIFALHFIVSPFLKALKK